MAVEPHVITVLLSQQGFRRVLLRDIADEHLQLFSIYWALRIGVMYRHRSRDFLIPHRP